ncbi:MAG: hypothetical protein ACSNEK_09075 [Parachlamydiaceae bacterium]
MSLGTISPCREAWENEVMRYQRIEAILEEDQVSEGDMDDAYEIALDVMDPFKRIRYLSDISSKLLSINSLSSWGKAYRIAQDVGDQTNVRGILKQIIIRCQETNDTDAQDLANEIDRFVQGYIINRLSLKKLF